MVKVYRLESMPDERRASLADLARLFLKLGTTAFGGPAAHIAMMEDEVVRRRRWLTRDAFLDYLGATNLIPGPNSTEMAMHIGQAQAGWRGLLVAGASFILPACLIVTALAWAYVRYQRVPAASGVLYGVKPVVIVVMAQAFWRLGRTALKTWTLAIVGALTLAAAVYGINELALLAAAGIVSATAAAGQSRQSMAGLLPMAMPASAASGVAVPFALSTLFLTFAKIGAVLFGSGYVLLAFVRADFVERLGWLTNRQLLDAVAVGQVTPGPVFTTATFIGYLLGGTRGAVVATAGIFLPAFVFVAISGALLPRLRRSRAAGAFLDGVNVASLALMLVVTITLSRSAIVDWVTAALAVAGAVALFGFRVNSAWLVAAAAVVGLIAR
jgi:chromate transporter